jgi:hypothetical protein
MTYATLEETQKSQAVGMVNISGAQSDVRFWEAAERQGEH